MGVSKIFEEMAKSGVKLVIEVESNAEKAKKEFEEMSAADRDGVRALYEKLKTLLGETN
jgi:hypothetical protein